MAHSPHETRRRGLYGEWLRAHHGPSLRKSDIRRHRTSLLRGGGIILPLASDQGRQPFEVAGSGEAHSKRGSNGVGLRLALPVLGRGGQ